MEKTGDTHITLAKKLWGVTAVGGTNGQQVAKWLRMEQMPSRGVAEYVAQYFGASLEEMLSDPDEYLDPSHLIVSKAGKPVGSRPIPKARAVASSAPAAVSVAPAPVKRPYNKKKMAPSNGQVVQIIDSRWTVPAGVPAPRLSFEVGPDTPPGMAKVQIDGFFPLDIGHALVTMGADHKPVSPREVSATVHTPAVEHKPEAPAEVGD